MSVAKTSTRPSWWTVLTLTLATGYLLAGVTSSLPQVRWPAIGGAMLIGAGLALADRSYRAATTVLALGAAAPAVTMWWSLVVPIIGVLVLICGVPALRSLQSARI